jgi:hypothetical protein
MELLATSGDLWALIGTSIVTLILLVPGVLYAWYVLEGRIGDDKSYVPVIASVEKHQ